MKVKLLGIRPYDPEIDGKWNDEYEYYSSLLKQVPFPLEVNAASVYPHTVNLKKYIIEEKYPDRLQTWGLVWFTYEKIK
jgi:hypothetical protein